MNTLEHLLFDASASQPVEDSQFTYGAYFMLRHNTTSPRPILDEIPEIYKKVFQEIKGVKVADTSFASSPRVPLDKHISVSVKKKNPVMVSTLELKQAHEKEVIVSHHFLYGTHWYLKTEKQDRLFSFNLNSMLRNYLTTVDRKGNNFLIQPVGSKEEQSIDRNTDDTISKFVRCMEIDDDVWDDPDSETEDNLIMFFNKMLHPPMKFALIYSYTN